MKMRYTLRDAIFQKIKKKREKKKEKKKKKKKKKKNLVKFACSLRALPRSDLGAIFTLSVFFDDILYRFAFFIC